MRDNERWESSLFDNAPVSLWEWDLSLVKRELDTLLSSQTVDLKAYLTGHQEFVDKCLCSLIVVGVNRKTLDVFGGSDSKRFADGYQRFFTQKTKLAFGQLLAKFAAGHSSFELETTVQNLQGVSLLVMFSASIVSGHESDWSRVVVSFVDISQRRHTEELLRSSEERYSMLLGNIEDVVYFLADDATISFVSEQTNKYGYSPEEIIGTNFSDIIYKEDQEWVLPIVDSELTTGKKDDRVIYFRINTGDGGFRWVEDRGRIVLDNAGKIIGRSGVIRDVTDRVTAEEHEKKHAEELLLLSQSAMEFVEVTDEKDIWRTIADRLYEIIGKNGLLVVAEFGQKGHLFLTKCFRGFDPVREKMEALFGCELSELKGGTSPEIIEAVRSGRLIGVEWNAFSISDVHVPAPVLESMSELVDVETFYVAGFVRKDDILGCISIGLPKGAPAPNASLIEAFVGQASVALARKRSEERLREMEEQLLQSQKLEAIGRLASGVAHDFNNMITAITAYCDLVLSEMDEGDSRRIDVEDIRQCAESSAALTRQLLVFSRKQKLKLDTIDVNSVLVNLEKMLRRVIGEDVELSVRTSQAPNYILADTVHIEQVIMNLAVNSRDAMPAGGHLSIETEEIEFSSDGAENRIGLQTGPYVRITVTDSGCGMSEEILERVFDPFFTTKEKGTGTGLGLSTVFGIVKQCGGDISVTSEPTKGTTIKIYFPRVPEPEEAAFLRRLSVIPKKCCETIMVVEDDDMVKRLAARVLRKKGYTVLEASSGQEAIHIAETYGGPIQLILMDVILPKMRGGELSKRIAAIQPGTKMLFMSGYDNKDISRTGELPPGIPLLEKPFTSADLSRRIREILDRASLSPSISSYKTEPNIPSAIRRARD